jgi:hypothetical protein
MPVLGQPTNKCEHGVFKGSEPVAKYCSFCNPDSMPFISVMTARRTDAKLKQEVPSELGDFDELLDSDNAFFIEQLERRISTGE